MKQKIESGFFSLWAACLFVTISITTISIISCSPVRIIQETCKTREVALKAWEIGYKSNHADTSNINADRIEFLKYLNQQ